LELVAPQIVHFQHLALLPLSLPALAKRFGAQVVFTLHDNFPLCPDPFLLDRPSVGHCFDVKKCMESGCFTRKFPLPKSAALRRREIMGEIFTRYTDRVVAPSEYMCHMAATVFNVKAQYIPHGISMPEIVHAKGARRRLGYIGNTIKAKGVHLLIEAFECI